MPLDELDQLPGCSGYVQSGIASLALAQMRMAPKQAPVRR